MPSGHQSSLWPCEFSAPTVTQKLSCHAEEDAPKSVAQSARDITGESCASKPGTSSMSKATTKLPGGHQATGWWLFAIECQELVTQPRGRVTLTESDMLSHFAPLQAESPIVHVPGEPKLVSNVLADPESGEPSPAVHS